MTSSPRTAATADAGGTRGRILDAARELILRRSPGGLTVAQIARAAGVSHRTVYRYFASKDELVLAVAERPTDRMPGLHMPTRWDEVRGALRVHWRHFGDNLDVLRSERMLPEGIELRRARLLSSRSAFDALLDDAGLPDSPERAPLRELLVHLTSSTTLLELVDRHGMTVDEASDIALDAVDVLVGAARRRAEGGEGG